MSAIQQPAAARFGQPRSLRLNVGIALMGLSLTAPGCSPQGDPVDNAQNVAAPAANSADATPRVTTLDNRVGNQIADKRRTLIADAISALQESYTALDLMAAGNADKAVAALARATGKLDIVLAADPELALAPVDVRVATHDVIATPADVKQLRDQAEAALDDGRLQDARRLIAGMASELVISTVNIPLASYPAAIKQAAALIHADRTAQARAMLETALATLVVQDTIIPLPLARAEALLALAQPLAEKAQRNADETARLQRLLADARLQIELAQSLGYATRDDLDALSDELKVIEDKTQSAGSGPRLFDRIKALFSQASRQANTPPQP
ncbi:YfdX family protein [Sphingomonas japonica]|uniref:YfdX protein n=1 Tax=Sphingomonas japonica TaxID=511662 RepID=A0ABX0U173_9SPHN|nr:YfdX family protein [Sphingomonas japonica]NIJ23419.1 hypothetical protein [Sphingomonas japonica]